MPETTNQARYRAALQEMCRRLKDEGRPARRCLAGRMEGIDGLSEPELDSLLAAVEAALRTHGRHERYGRPGSRRGF